jgi:hypothetical protein
MKKIKEFVLKSSAAGKFLKPQSVLLTMFLLLTMFPLIARAQGVSGVTGVVTDPSGALIPGVQVILVDTKTSRELTATTNDQGVYIFNNVQPGAGYRLTFTATGFQTFVLNDVQLGIGRTETHNATLVAGQVSATVEVTSTSGDATLNTTDPSIGNVIGERQIRELPIQFRDNPAALIGLQPGVIGNNVGTGAVNRVGSVTGSRADQGNITVDGIDSNDVATGQAFVTVGNLPIDSVQEFRAITSNPNASEGRSSGGQIQLATRSGTNEFHGSLREYFRTDKTAANTFFNNRNGIERPRLERHQFGGSLSGPLPFFNFGEGGPLFRSGKDRLFFFFDYEGRRDDSEISDSRIVPLQHFREGRIAYINDNPGCGSSSRLDTTPNCISFLTPAEVAALDPQGIGPNQALLNLLNSRYPAANDITGGDGVNTGLFRFNAPLVVEQNTYTTRIDGNISDNQRAFGRLTLTRNDSTNALELFPGDGDSERLVDDSYQLLGGHTWVITPSFTNQATVGVSRQKWSFPVPQSPSFPTDFNTTISAVRTIGGLIQAPFADFAFQDRDVIVPTIRDDATWTIGSHTLFFGGVYKPIRQKSTLVSDFNYTDLGLGGNLSQLDASLRPSNIFTGTTGAASNFDTAFTFLLGRYQNFDTYFFYDKNGVAQTPGTGRKRNYAYNEYELYLQDNWKLRSDLTLNLGVRWHFYPAPYEVNGFQASNDVDFEELIEKRIANANAGISGPDAEPLLRYTLSGKANDGEPLYEPDYNNFAPRIGFAYNPSFKGGLLGAVFGDRKTVLRGGASIVYDRVGGAVTFIQDQATYLFDNYVSVPFGSANARSSLLNDPRFAGFGVLPLQNAAPTITSPFTPYVEDGVPVGLAQFQANYVVAKNFETPYSYQWSFGVQRELPGDFILDVSYIGRAGRKLFAQGDASQVLNFKDAASGQMMFDALNALQAQLQANTPAANITAQPWIENQLSAGIAFHYGQGITCQQLGAAFGANVPNCTRLLRAFFSTAARTGNTSSLVASLYANGFLNPNVGMSGQFAANAYITNLGKSDYNGMLVSLQKRFSKGFQFDANYTWSHSIDNTSSVTNSAFGGTLCDITDVNACRGDAEFDLRHLFNANGVWDLPFGRNRSIGKNIPKWLNFFVGDWTVAGIFTARSGLPATATTGVFSVTLLRDTPPVLIGDPSTFAVDVRDQGTGIQYFADPDDVQAALRYPLHGESGARNIFRSEPYWNIDMVVSKKFPMPWSENHLLTFRAEAYNLTNSNFFSPPNLIFGSTNFGRITTSQSTPRVLQFALRYDF